jgi:hypothetical protein
MSKNSELLLGLRLKLQNLRDISAGIAKGNYSELEEEILNGLNQAECTLEDIGSSQRELNTLRTQCR